MRILVAVEPTMYRETLVHVLRRNRPDDDVRLTATDSLEEEATSFGPHLIVCSDGAPEVRQEDSITFWVVIRYQNNMSASVFLTEREPYLIENISVEDLLGVIEETARLIA